MIMGQVFRVCFMSGVIASLLVEGCRLVLVSQDRSFARERGDIGLPSRAENLMQHRSPRLARQDGRGPGMEDLTKCLKCGSGHSLVWIQAGVPAHVQSPRLKILQVVTGAHRVRPGRRPWRR
jgi:hypothetical protein